MNTATKFSQNFLKSLRRVVEAEKLDINRLPCWLKFANIKFVKLHNSSIFLFEDATDKLDTFHNLGKVLSDLQFFFGLPEYTPRGASLKIPNKEGGKLIIMEGELKDAGKSVFEIKSEKAALFDAGYTSYHIPFAIVNLFVRLSSSLEVSSIRFIPMALYVHDKDILDFNSYWEKCTPHIQNLLINLDKSITGDYYEKNEEVKNAFLITKEHSVVVFGSYAEPEYSELIKVRDYLLTAYRAVLINELPEIPSMSLEEKVRLWASASRFCVMVDRIPAGHLVEYPYLKSTRTVLILLRPKTGGSTRMIENNPVDLPFIKTFQFDKSPLEVMEEALTWAEDFIRKKSTNA